MIHDDVLYKSPHPRSRLQSSESCKNGWFQSLSPPL